MHKYFLKFWGILDFAYIGYYLIGTISSGHIPFVWEVSSSISTSTSYENNLPLYMTLASLALLLSTVWTGFILLKEKLSWAWLVYSQFPFRILLVMPSIFFISWFIPENGGMTQVTIVGILIIVIESFKIYSIYRLNRLLNQNLHVPRSLELDVM